MDPNGIWWTDTELNEYIGAWYDRLQEKFEFVYNTATITTALATQTIATVAPDMLRLDAVYWNGTRMVGRDKDELEVIQRDWRAMPPAIPFVVYQDDTYSFSIWPIPAQAGTMVLEYPIRGTFTNDSTPIATPAWTRYSAIDYCVARAYLRAGPNQDIQKFQRRKIRFMRWIIRFLTIRDQYFPDRTPTIRPGIDAGGVFRQNATRYEGDILNAGQNTTVFQTWF
jgi:hypothetical protein